MANDEKTPPPPPPPQNLDPGGYTKGSEPPIKVDTGNDPNIKIGKG